MESRNVMPMTVTFVTCALKRRNGTHTKHDIFNRAFNDIEMPFLNLLIHWDKFCILVRRN